MTGKLPQITASGVARRLRRVEREFRLAGSEEVVVYWEDEMVAARFGDLWVMAQVRLVVGSRGTTVGYKLWHDLDSRQAHRLLTELKNWLNFTLGRRNLELSNRWLSKKQTGFNMTVGGDWV